MQISARYHDKRERFYDGWDRSTKLVSFFGGAAAFAWLKADALLASITSVAICLSAGLSLVFQFSTKARRHAELARDYKKLNGTIEKSGSSPSSEEVGDWHAQFYALESGEPASLGALVTACHNELCVATGHPDLVTPLGWWENLWRNYYDFDQSSLPAKNGQPLK